MKHSLILITISTLLALAGCSTPQRPLPDYELATTWADMTLYITRYTPANTPTYASRGLGYVSLTMYESVVHGSPEYQSLAGQLNGLASLPQPDTTKTYNWPLALNAGQAAILKAVYNQTSDANKLKIDSLETTLRERLTNSDTDAEVVQRSVAFGRAVAARIFAWSRTDGGHRAYLKNFDKTLTFAERLGGWKPPLFAQSFSHHPLHPHWGKNRTFLKQNAQIAPPQPLPCDTLPTSAYYQDFRRVYEQEKTLTQAQKEAAIWWSDDPDETFTPPGHSYYIATRAIEKTKPTAIKCAETYARVGMAVADAFIDCWKWKYEFFTERPNTFVYEHIDQRWESFWPDPPFPAFPSGHAIQGAAAATVLTNLYGNVILVDSAHAGRPRDELRNTEFRPRRFSSFWQIAEETANSRFYGGIHTPQDNVAGLEKGKEIGVNINNLQWRMR